MRHAAALFAAVMSVVYSGQGSRFSKADLRGAPRPSGSAHRSRCRKSTLKKMLKRRAAAKMASKSRAINRRSSK